MHSRRLSRVQVSVLIGKMPVYTLIRKRQSFFCRFLVSQTGKVDSDCIAIYVKVHSPHYYKCTYIFVIYIFQE